MPEIKLVIAQNDKIIQTITKEISKSGFAKSVEDFQVIANATMTKLIEDAGESGHCLNMEEDSDESENDEEDHCVSPKKKKK